VKKTKPRCSPECCESCPLAEAMKTIARLEAEKTECERRLRVFVDALKEADRRLEGVAPSTSSIH
jgi:hypothetical protein